MVVLFPKSSDPKPSLKKEVEIGKPGISSGFPTSYSLSVMGVVQGVCGNRFWESLGEKTVLLKSLGGSQGGNRFWG